MTNKVLAVAGMTLMVLGTVLLGYAAMLDMSYTQPHRWRDRPPSSRSGRPCSWYWARY